MYIFHLFIANTYCNERFSNIFVKGSFTSIFNLINKQWKYGQCLLLNIRSLENSYENYSIFQVQGEQTPLMYASSGINAHNTVPFLQELP